MAALAGTGGNVTIGGVDIDEIGEWTLDIDANSIDTSKFGVIWRTFITSIRGWSGTFMGSWAVGTDTPGQGAVQTNLFAGTAIALALFTDVAHNYSGQAFVTKLSTKTPVTGKVDISCSFVGDGVLAWV